MGSEFFKLLKESGVEIEERHRGGPEDGNDPRSFVEQHLVDNHRDTVHVITTFKPELTAYLAELLECPDLTNEGGV